MNKLEETYKKADNLTLIRIVEDPESYTKECIELVSNELLKREIDREYIIEIATEFMKERVIEMLKTFSPLSDKLTLPFSNFLSKAEIIDIIKVEFDIWLERRDDFGFDVWLYSIGAII